MVSGSIGERIAAYRRRRGMSQAALAGLIGRSESWLSQVERGVRSVDRLSILLDLAKILHVEAEALTGRPWQYAPNGGTTPTDLDDVRKYFARYDHLFGATGEPSMDFAGLRTFAADAHRIYQAAEYEPLVRQLPELLLAADSLHASSPGPNRRETLLSYVSAYVVAAKLLTKMGASDLALLAADRCATAALEADSDEAQGMAAYQVVCALLKADRPEDAEGLAIRMATRLQSVARSDSPSLVSVCGALWLASAVIAARRTDRDEAWRRLGIAQELAEKLGHDANFAWTAFGPTNVAIHRVSVAAELGDTAEALHAATAVNTDQLPAGLNSRRAQVSLDLAWAQAQRKRDAEALLHLLEAERSAPAAVRYNVVVREMVREMLTRSKRSKNSALHSLAVRSGVLD
ncbi:transcriptional regulator with XRE-family HTH domain [Krasilnikovia cinnamomea]|uniref:Transcriptional regulator with XRE-family HTH domain n=1 Tax=Krasilnikovia cinnamomea TaxID=349313 RepID=A0A4Q7ZGN2_9ACTN|nr:helix-turn-helix domain-containing protein [Krasilnikovia cinnamomea]RZU49343.1 transcriptional regulator with XRE-family HTH domain [Krasilnikovia cinnamomea]